MSSRSPVPIRTTISCTAAGRAEPFGAKLARSIEVCCSAVELRAINAKDPRPAAAELSIGIPEGPRPTSRVFDEGVDAARTGRAAAAARHGRGYIASRVFSDGHGPRLVAVRPSTVQRSTSVGIPSLGMLRFRSRLLHGTRTSNGCRTWICPTILRANAAVSLIVRRQVTNCSGGHTWERAIPRRGCPVQECMGSIYTCAVILYIFLIITLGRAMIKGFKSKVLKRYWTKADQSLIRPDQVIRVGLILTVLDNATKLDDVASIVSFAFHPLKGDQKGPLRREGAMRTGGSRLDGTKNARCHRSRP